jgi:predicted transcriptional regulator of viral defense system
MPNLIVQEFAKLPFFTSREAKKRGLDPHLIAYYVKKGVFERVARGVYSNPQVAAEGAFEWQDLFEMAQSIPDGTICLISALSYYGLTLEFPKSFWIAVPHRSRAPRRPLTRIIRMRNMSLGRRSLVVGKYRTHIFDRERCVVDAFRFLSRETALQTLRAYLKPTDEAKPDLSKLVRFAKALRVDIRPYLEALT